MYLLAFCFCYETALVARIPSSTQVANMVIPVVALPPWKLTKTINYMAAQIRLSRKQRKEVPAAENQDLGSIAVRAAEVAAATFYEILNQRSDKIMDFTISRVDSAVEKLQVIFKETEKDMNKMTKPQNPKYVENELNFVILYSLINHSSVAHLRRIRRNTKRKWQKLIQRLRNKQLNGFVRLSRVQPGVI